MIEKLIEKLKKDIDCNLSSDEIKLLYGIDYFDIRYDILLSGYISLRDKCYEDLVKIFGCDKIATDKKEINENTVVFIGYLSIGDENIPTYNLRYIYGSLELNTESALRLENLEKVFGECQFYALKNLKGLENLCRIDTLHLNKISDYYNLAQFEYIDTLYIDDYLLSKIRFPKYLRAFRAENVESDNGNYFDNLEFPENLKYLYIPKMELSSRIILPRLREINALSLNDVKLPSSLNDITIKSRGNLECYKFNKTVNRLILNYLKLKNVILPEKLDYICMDSLRIENVTWPVDCKHIVCDELKKADTIVIPNDINFASFKKLEHVNNFIFPDEMNPNGHITIGNTYYNYDCIKHMGKNKILTL